MTPYDPTPIPDDLTSGELILHLLGRSLVAAVLAAELEDEHAARLQRKESAA